MKNALATFMHSSEVTTPSKVRLMTNGELRLLEKPLIIQSQGMRIAVVIPYEMYLKVQAEFRRCIDMIGARERMIQELRNAASESVQHSAHIT